MASRGTFYLADTSNNRVLKITADDLEPGTLFASVGSLNELALVNQKTGVLTPFLANLHGPHGLVFLPGDEDN
jgi:hypothetical protein